MLLHSCKALLSTSCAHQSLLLKLLEKVHVNPLFTWRWILKITSDKQSLWEFKIETNANMYRLSGKQFYVYPEPLKVYASHPVVSILRIYPIR